MRTFTGKINIVIGAWLIILTLYQLYTSMFGIYEAYIQRGVHVLFVLPMAFILFPATKKSQHQKLTLLDIILAIISIFPPLYIVLNNDKLIYRLKYVDDATNIEIILGSIMILLLIEAVRRAVVTAMAVLIIVSFGYLYFAEHLSGVFYSSTPALQEVIQMQYLFTDDGMFGSITGVSATFVAIFVILGVFMEKTQTGKFFTDFACRLAGGSPGGPAKIAIVSSGFFGSISGVAAANVYSTGVFTIPLMKKLGYQPRFAAAVEASASTGGMLMPPVMGAGAFVMSELTRVPYFQIAIAATLCAVFYYASLLMRVHLTAKRDNLEGIAKEDLVPFLTVMKDSYLLLPLVILVMLLFKGFSPFYAANCAIGTSFIISFFRKNTRMTPSVLAETLRRCGANMVMIALACAGAGMVVAIVTQTGLGLGLAAVITNWSNGMLFPALFLAMIASLVLGMGLPCTPAYVIAITVSGPILLALNCPLLASHLFVFYFAILAGVTPPVCIPAFCAASIAGTDPQGTGFEAFRLSIVGFFIPYIFMYNPALLMQGNFTEIFVIIIILTIAVYIFAVSLTGFFIKKINLQKRIIAFIISMIVLFFATQTKIINTLPVQIIALLIFLTISTRFFYSIINKFHLKKTEL